jgi:hypothetical protein
MEWWRATRHSLLWIAFGLRASESRLSSRRSSAARTRPAPLLSDPTSTSISSRLSGTARRSSIAVKRSCGPGLSRCAYSAPPSTGRRSTASGLWESGPRRRSSRSRAAWRAPARQRPPRSRDKGRGRPRGTSAPSGHSPRVRVNRCRRPCRRSKPLRGRSCPRPVAAADPPCGDVCPRQARRER